LGLPQLTKFTTCVPIDDDDNDDDDDDKMATIKNAAVVSVKLKWNFQNETNKFNALNSRHNEPDILLILFTLNLFKLIYCKFIEPVHKFRQ